jgi:nitrate/nitrite transporter NarK
MYGSARFCLTSVAVPYARHASAALLPIAIAVLFANFCLANMYGAITDLFPERQIGRATGLTGFCAGLSGLLFPLATGWMVDHSSYIPAFVSVCDSAAAGRVFIVCDWPPVSAPRRVTDCRS